MRPLRIARISSVHGSKAVKTLYAAQPLHQKTYAEQLAAILGQKIYYSDTFETAMRSLGNEALTVIYDIEPLQNAWCRENDLDGAREGLTGTALAQLKKWRPDVVFLQDIFTLPTQIRKQLKDLVPSVKAVVMFKGSPGGMEEAGGFDLVFAATPHLVEAFERQGLKSRLLYHSFDETNWKTFEAERLVAPAAGGMLDRPYPATFAGMSGYGWGLDFQSRYWSLRRLFEKVGEFEAWVDERESATDWKSRAWFGMKALVDACPDGPLIGMSRAAGCPDPLKRAAAQTLFWRRAQEANRRQFPDEALFQKSKVPTRPLRALFPSRCHAPVFGLELYRLLGKSRITFNRHTDVVAGDAGNIRLFEATGMGTCLVTERCKNIGDLFVDGSEIVTYTHAEEAVEKIRHLIDHPAESDRVARAGQARTLRDHSALARARVVNEELQKLVAQV